MGCNSSSAKEEAVPTLGRQQTISNPDYDPKYKHYDASQRNSVTKVVDPVVHLEGAEAEKRMNLTNQVFDILNTSGSGSVSFAEFMDWVKPRSKDQNMTEEEKAERKDQNAWLLFRMDKNRNAHIDRPEMQDFFTRYTVSEVERILADLKTGTVEPKN